MTDSEVRPLQVNKRGSAITPPPSNARPLSYDFSRSKQAGDAIGNKTRNLRSFWTDLEKQNDSGFSPPAPDKSPNLSSSGSARLKNNPFWQNDSPRGSPKAAVSPRVGSGGNRFGLNDGATNRPTSYIEGLSDMKTPTLKFGISTQTTRKYNTEGSDQIVSEYEKQPHPVYTDDLRKSSSPSPQQVQLAKKSSLSGQGSFSRLHGPRLFGVDSALNGQSKLKKTVTFDHKAEVIQYESVTPDMSSESPALGNRCEEEGEDDDEEDEDHDFSSVPVIEPVGHRRPLPQLPGFSEAKAGNDEPDLSQVDSSYSDGLNSVSIDTSQLPVEGGATYSAPNHIDEALSYPPASPVSSVYSDDGSGVDGDSTPDISTSQSLSRRESLLESQRKVSTEYHGNAPYAREPSAAQVQRTMSQKRRSLVQVLENSSNTSVNSILEEAPMSDSIDDISIKIEPLDEGLPITGTGQITGAGEPFNKILIANDAHHAKQSPKPVVDKPSMITRMDPLPPIESSSPILYMPDHHVPANEEVESLIIPEGLSPSNHPRANDEENVSIRLLQAVSKDSAAGTALPIGPRPTQPQSHELAIEMAKDSDTAHGLGGVRIKEEPVDESRILVEAATSVIPEPQIKQELAENSPVPSLVLPQDAEKTPDMATYSPIKQEEESFARLWSPELESGLNGENSTLLDFPSVGKEFTAEFPDMLRIQQDHSPSLGDDAHDHQEVSLNKPMNKFGTSKATSQEGRSTIRSSSGTKSRPSLTPQDVSRIARTKSLKDKTNVEDQHILQELNKQPVPVLHLLDDEISTDGESIFGDLDEQFDKLLQVQKNSDVVYASERRISDSHRKISGPVKRIEPTKTHGINSPTILEEGAAKENEMVNEERGRLFLRLLSVKDVSLPNIEEKAAKYSITLDNGVHCITTNYRALHKSSIVDEEFELSVDDQLEFILTLKAKWTKHVTVFRKPVPAPQREVRDYRSRTGLSKLFSPSSKKKEIGTPSSPQTISSSSKELPKPDSWESLLSNDGYFGRAYIDFAQYEKEVYGKPMIFEISCFNEWAKTGGKTRGPPYSICRLQIQMMFVPRVMATEVLPRSIQEATELLKRAKVQDVSCMEGFLSQLGGDCKYWRRRYFTLTNTTLTAHSETSRKPRAIINLAKAIRVVEDKSQLTEPTVVIGKNRRKSAFAEQEEGFMFVDEGFRLRFANGEIIDFYADTRDAKKKWVSILNKVVNNKEPARSPWIDKVLKS